MSVLNASTLDGSNGFVINGVAEDDFSGRSVSGAGDINGDGIDDVIIGAFGADPNGNNFAGTSYVVFGRQTGFSPSLDLAALDGSDGFAINGLAELDLLGRSVSGAGDINGDGIDDLIIGAYGADPNGNNFAGTSYVVFGRQTGFGANFDLSTLNGSNGFAINGVAELGQSGRSVSGAGDINGDGIDDLIIGAPFADPNGQSYVVFGRQMGFEANFDLSTLNGSNGFAINGVASDDSSGYSVSGVGDINGDGINDLIIGADRADPNGNSEAGTSYVVFGRQTGFGTSLDLSTLNGSNGFAINGVASGDLSGFSASEAGDINGDGINDLIIGAVGTDPNGTNNAGTSYVVFGRQTGFDASLDLSILDGSNGFAINGAAELEQFVRAVGGAGDINGDDIDDLIIGASGTDPNGNLNVGASYVVFGRQTGFEASLDLAMLDSSNSLTINGVAAGDFFGGSVAGAGDINGDGIDDVIIGASGADPDGNSSAGSSYVVFGRRDADHSGPTPGDDNLTGTNGRDVIFALAGNDIVQGLGGADRLGGDEGNDILLGGEGNDRLFGGDGNDNLIGGAGRDRSLGGEGNDRLTGGADNDRLVGGNGDDNLIGGVGDDTLIGGADDDRLLGAGGNDLMRGNLGDDVLNGGAGNDRQFGGAGRDRLNGQGGNDVLRGGADRDVLRGGAGNDRLIGEAGNDLIATGTGSDRIVIRSGQGFDRVTDFADGQDLIVLGGIQFGQLTLQQQGSDVRVSLGNESLLLLQNLNVGQLSQADFV
ncbi:hypothetical protein [Vacuolonema iberomarrocanum]|uniref:hypothetical protein n=1 Tax=Vacuolonema iberomarrocanum TaxID=3454632 RepID=UPI0019EB32F5|nr:FG-GAP repeat protein [filamentous cyanobacterium LEGE 07170]